MAKKVMMAPMMAIRPALFFTLVLLRMGLFRYWQDNSALLFRQLDIITGLGCH